VLQGSQIPYGGWEGHLSSTAHITVIIGLGSEQFLNGKKEGERERKAKQVVDSGVVALDQRGGADVRNVWPLEILVLK